MARISSAPEGGKFRARAAAELDEQAGTWGNGDLLVVALDGNGELVLSDGTDAEGIIWVPESRRETATQLANFQQVIGGKVYTVFTWAELQEMAMGDDPSFSAGDQVYADADGAVVVGEDAGAAGGVYLGVILPDETVTGGGGLRMVLNVGSKPVATGSGGGD